MTLDVVDAASKKIRLENYKKNRIGRRRKIIMKICIISQFLHWNLVKISKNEVKLHYVNGVPEAKGENQ